MVGSPLLQLPLEVLQRVLALAADAADLPTHTVSVARLAVVCRRFNQALQGPSCLWDRVTLPAAHLPDAARLRSLAGWLRPRARSVRAADMHIGAGTQYEGVAVALLAEHLQQLALRGDAEMPETGGSLSVPQHMVDAAYVCERLVDLTLTGLHLLVQLSGLSALTALTRLAASYQRVDFAQGPDLPPELCRLTQLRVLKFSSTGLRVLPAEVSQLAQLGELRLHGAAPPGLALPAQMSALRSLQILQFKRCTLPSNWPDLQPLRQLRHVYMERCYLSGELPQAVCSLPSLADLSMFFCQNTNQEAPLGVAHLSLASLLTGLRLGGCTITELPPALPLPRLTHLLCWENQLSALPPAISALTALTKLYLKGNEEPLHLPVEMTALVSLRDISLEECVLCASPGLRALLELPSLAKVCLKDAMPHDSEGLRCLMEFAQRCMLQQPAKLVLSWN